MTIFFKNVSFWRPYLSSKHFSYPPLKSFCRGVSFQNAYDYFFSGPKKVGKLVKSFVTIVFTTRFFFRIQILIFFFACRLILTSRRRCLAGKSITNIVYFSINIVFINHVYRKYLSCMKATMIYPSKLDCTQINVIWINKLSFYWTNLSFNW